MEQTELNLPPYQKIIEQSNDDSLREEALHVLYDNWELYVKQLERDRELAVKLKIIAIAAISFSLLYAPPILIGYLRDRNPVLDQQYVVFASFPIGISIFLYAKRTSDNVLKAATLYKEAKENRNNRHIC